MAEQLAGAVAAAVINGITDRALATVMRKLRPGSGPAAAHEKLQRLETLVLNLRCAVEVSEKHAIGSASLLEWRDRLREAAEESGAVVLGFQRRAREDGGGEAASTSTSTPGQGQRQPAAAAEGGAVVLDFQRRAREDGGGDAASTSASASASAPGQQQPAGGVTSGALYFTRSALSGMAQRVRDVTSRLFSTDEDMKKLDGALEKMERLSPDITQFLMALQLEVTVELAQRDSKKRPPPPPPPPAERSQRRRESTEDIQWESSDCEELHLPRRRHQRRSWSPARHSSAGDGWDLEQHSSAGDGLRFPYIVRKIMQLVSAEAEEAEDPEREARMLATVLEPSLQGMESFIKATDDRDMEGFEWLAELAALLRETVERGNAVLQTLRRSSESDAIHRQAGGALDLEEDGELYSFARAAEGLARYKQFFTVLGNLYAKQSL